MGNSNKPKTINELAHQLFLEGQYVFRPRTKEATDKALELFKRATALQPDFADGFAALGAAYLGAADNHHERTDLIPAAGTALAQALTLDPTNLKAIASHLDLALHNRDWRAASEDAGRLRAINPYSATTLHEHFRYYQLLGFPERALEAARRSAMLDPLSFVGRINVTAALLHLARWQEAAIAAKRALELHPKMEFAMSMLCSADARGGHFGDARSVAADLAKATGVDTHDGCLFDIAIGEGRRADARILSDVMASRFPGGELSATDLADNYATAGYFDQAVTWLERAYDAGDFTLFTIRFDKGIPPAFFDTAGWKIMARRPAMMEWQKAHDQLAAQLATEEKATKS